MGEESLSPEAKALWDAINAYAVACGGDPSKHVYGNTRRQTAVSEVEQAIYPYQKRIDRDQQIAELNRKLTQEHATRTGLQEQLGRLTAENSTIAAQLAQANETVRMQGIDIQQLGAALAAFADLEAYSDDLDALYDKFADLCQWGFPTVGRKTLAELESYRETLRKLRPLLDSPGRQLREAAQHIIDEAMAGTRFQCDDTIRMDFLDSHGTPGLPWLARESTTGRGYRLHQAHADAKGHPTARQAIDHAMFHGDDNAAND